MVKIAIDARDSGESSGRYDDKLIEYLHKLKTDHQFVIITRPHRVEFLKQIAPDFEVIETTFKWFGFGEQLGFLKQIASLKADLVHFLMVQQPILYRGRVVTTMQDLTTARFKNPSKNPVVFWFKQQVYVWVSVIAAHKSRAIITPTRFVKDDIVQFTRISPNKVTVTLESADPITDKPELITNLNGKQFIMYIGRPMPHKNLERLIEAFVELKAQHPDLYLVLAGKKDANYLRIEQSVKDRQITNIVFTDFISEGKLRWLYEHCAAYVFPSLSEGFGLPGLEAMMHGAPVVSSNATCLPEVYGPAAHYFNPLDVQAMANAINDVLTNKDLRTNLIVTGKLQVQKYSWRRMAQQTLEVYNHTLG